MTAAPPRAIDMALLRLAEYDSEERREVLYRALLDGELWVPINAESGTDDDAEGESASDDAAPEFVLLEDEARRVRMPAFTLRERAEEFLRDGMTLLRYPAVLLFELAVKNRITAVVLNPGSAASLRLLPGELKLLASREIPSVGTLGVSQRGDVPTRGLGDAPSPQFARHLARTLRGFPLLESATLFRMSPAGDAERVFLGVKFDARADDADIQTALRQLGDRIISPPEYPGLELIVLTADLAVKVASENVPVYERGTRH